MNIATKIIELVAIAALLFIIVNFYNFVDVIDTEFEGTEIYGNRNTTITFIGTGSGTRDVSFEYFSNIIELVIANYTLSTFEPSLFHGNNKQYVMGYTTTLFTSASYPNQNGYLQSDPQGLEILKQILDIAPIQQTVSDHIYKRMNIGNFNSARIIAADQASAPSVFEINCTVPVVGSDNWHFTDYNVNADDCGFFTGQHQGDNNCYAYATDIATNTFPQPGRGSGQEWTFNNCKNMIAAAERDGLTSIGQTLSNYSIGPSDGHYVALYIWPQTNFHWARMDFNGTYNDDNSTYPKPRRWSHKPGGTEVQIVDNNGNCIGDIAPCVLPSDADLSPWSVFCGYLKAIPSKLTIN